MAILHWEYADATTPREDTSVFVINQLIGRSMSYGLLRKVLLKFTGFTRTVTIITRPYGFVCDISQV